MDRVNALKIGGLFTVFIIMALVGAIRFWSEGYGLFFGKACLLVLGPALLIATFVYSRKWIKTDSILYKIKRQPIIPVKNCVSGTPAQVNGKTKAAEPLLTSPFKKEPCVFYHYLKERYVQGGKNSYWKIVENKANYIDFKVRDESSEISVNLRNVDTPLYPIASDRLSKNKLMENQLENQKLIDFEHSELDAKTLCMWESLKKTEKFLSFKFNAKYRVSEYILPENQKVFVNGWVYEDNGKKFIAESKELPLIVSRKSKKEYLEDFAKGDNFFYNSNYLLFLGAVTLLIGLNFFVRVPIEYALLFFGLIFARIAYTTFNRAVKLENRCENSKSQIEVEIKKRNDLLPKLAGLVKKYSEYEEKTLENITRARVELKKTLTKEKLREYMQKQGLLKKVFLTIEKYPEIKADELFNDLLGRMAAIEENIAYFRGFYNKTVLKYNTLIQQFPFVLILKPLKFKEKEYYSFKEKKKPLVQQISVQKKVNGF